MRGSDMTNTIKELQKLGQSIWFDNVSRGLIKSGDLQKLIDTGVTGLTSNPSIFEKAISSGADYDDAMVGLARGGKSAADIFEALAIEDIRDVADLLRPIYDATGGRDGFASLEVNPHLAADTDGTIAEARRLYAELGRPNVMIKVPATPEGIPAVKHLIGEGINVNITLIFSLQMYAQVREAYLSGLEKLASDGGDVSKVGSVASFFVSRVDTTVDGQLEDKIRNGNPELKGLLGQAAIANAKLAYREFNNTFGQGRFAELQGKGANVQRPLWASTSVKNPAYSDVLYVDSLIGNNTVNTLPDVTLEAYLDHGDPKLTLTDGVDAAAKAAESLEKAGVSMEQVTSKLLADGVKAFADSFDTLLGNVDAKRVQLLEKEGSR
ncbi:MAG: transaldolase [Chloroflexi bacterium]|nr:transaldolase [Chloroflexota bacterium]MDA1228185.1 transaldolase [Chloroflexota bacterium]